MAGAVRGRATAAALRAQSVPAARPVRPTVARQPDGDPCSADLATTPPCAAAAGLHRPAAGARDSNSARAVLGSSEGFADRTTRNSPSWAFASPFGCHLTKIGTKSIPSRGPLLSSHSARDPTSSRRGPRLESFRRRRRRRALPAPYFPGTVRSLPPTGHTPSYLQSTPGWRPRGNVGWTAPLERVMRPTFLVAEQQRGAVRASTGCPAAAAQHSIAVPPCSRSSDATGNARRL